MANYRIYWDDGNKPRITETVAIDDMELQDQIVIGKLVPYLLIDKIIEYTERNVKFDVFCIPSNVRK